MNQITLNDLQKYFNEMQENFSANTIKKIYIQVHSCIKFAMIQGIIFRGVTLQKAIKQNNINVFSKEEQNKIIAYLDIRDIIDCLIYFTFYTGLRLGEVLGLKWSDISNNILKVRKQYREM